MTLRHRVDLHGGHHTDRRPVAQLQNLAMAIMLEPAVQMLARLRETGEGTPRAGAAKQSQVGERGPRPANVAVPGRAATSGRWRSTETDRGGRPPEEQPGMQTAGPPQAGRSPDQAVRELVG